MKPHEMPRATHYGNNYYIMFSRKLQRNVTAYSTLEYENLLTLEMDPAVEYYCEQPLKITVNTEDSEKSSIFDVWVLYNDGTEEFQEVKYLYELNGSNASSKRTQKQVAIQEKWCAACSFHYCVRNDKLIKKSKYYINNLKILAGKIRHSKLEVSEYLKKEVIQFLHNKRVPLKDIMCQDFLMNGREMELLALLYYDGVIKMDLIAAPISPTTEVSLYGE